METGSDSGDSASVKLTEAQKDELVREIASMVWEWENSGELCREFATRIVDVILERVG